MKKVIITGASSMIGSTLAEICVNKDIEVFALVRENSNKVSNLIKNDKIILVEADINNISDAKSKLPIDADCFYHFAWQGVSSDARYNVKLQESDIRNTIECVRLASDCGCKKFIFAGSQAEYGVTDKPRASDTPCNPITPYGIAKLCASRLANIYANQLDMRFCSGRILSAYGIKDNNFTMIKTILIKMLNNEDCDLSECNQRWDYVYETDVAKAFYLIGKSGIDGKYYPIGNGQDKTLKEYILIMREITKSNSKLNFGAVNSIKNLDLKVNNSELVADTGYFAEVDFETGISKIVKYLMEVKGE